MTDTEFRLDDIEPTPVDEPIPNHHATARPGVFGGKSRSVKSPPKVKREAPPKLEAHVRQKLEDFYTFAGLACMPFDPVLGQVVVESAQPCAKSVFDLAQENDAFRRAVIAFTTASTIGAVITAHAPIMLTLAARHSKGPLKDMGISGMQMFGKDLSQDPTGDGDLT